MIKIQALIILVMGCALGLAAQANPLPSSPELIKQGHDIFMQTCTPCHGEQGLGNGVAAIGLDPKPRNLVYDPFQNGTKPEQIFSTIAKGIPGSAMVGFPHMSEHDRWALAYYILSIRKKK